SASAGRRKSGQTQERADASAGGRAGRRTPPTNLLGVVRNIVGAVAPERLGSGFRWLLASSWLNNTGDGIAIASGPLLVASLTDKSFLIASGALLQWLPPLLFGLWAGVLSDRGNRRLIVVTVEWLRAAILVALSLTIVTGTVTVALALSALFLLATA